MHIKKLLSILFLTCFVTTLYAQYEVTIDAFVLDKTTGQPIPYVNIGFIEKSIGTVSNEEGKFTLTYHEDIIGGKELLQFSTLGYKTLKVRASQLVPFLTNTNKFYLEPAPELLEEVLIFNEKHEQVRVGYSGASDRTMGYWKEKDALGGEIATVVKIKKKNTKLLDVKFNVIENTSDSLKIRINIYDYKKRYPGQKFTKANVYHTIKSEKGEEAIDLKSFNLSVDDDIVVGIELLEVYGDSINFAISASNMDEFYLKKDKQSNEKRQLIKGISFTRYKSQDSWKRFFGTAINFSVLTSEPIDKDKEVSIERVKPKKITLYWDTSLSMADRDIEKELDFLSTYFKELKNTDVEVVTFNITGKESKVFSLNEVEGEDIFNYLRRVSYDGATDYSKILKSNDFKADAILLFTNGNYNFSSIQPEINVPVFCVNSQVDANHSLLQKTAFYADGHYINLSKISTKLGLDFIMNEVDDKEIYSNDNETTKEGLLYGKVFHVAGIIQGATIRVKNTFIESQSDAEGYFNIKAKEGDILVVNYLGMIEKEVLVSSENDFYILLKSEGELLDEVVVTGEGKKDNTIETGYGKKSKEAIGYSLNTITSKDIKPHYTSWVDVIRGQFAGVRVSGLDPNNPKFVMRGGGSILNPAYALIEIDGAIYSDNPPHINPQDIESITILKSLAATNIYGGRGRGGVIKIQTKYLSRNKGNGIEDTALIKGNDYTEKDIPLITNINIKPTYLNELEKASSFKEAKSIYNNQKNQDSQLSIPFFFDVSDYFMKWNKEFAFAVLTNIVSVANDNPKALKTLAYKFEELNKYEEAKYIYERLLVLRPNHEQSYRDLALSYNITGDYNKSLGLYKKMLSNSIIGLEFEGLKQVIGNELKHLIAFHRSKVNYRDLPTDYLSGVLKYDLRIVFEWNDPNAEFELQFINPQKKFYKWTHTRFENKERMIDEINHGYHTEEYIIDDADPGEWIINIENFSEESLLNPTYLKYTVYKNYGLQNETKRVKVIKLFEQNQKVTLDKFFYK